MCAERFSVVLSLTLMLFLGAGPALASIGTVVDVRPGATVTADGSTQRINAGMKIDSGDVIKTDAKGIVQLIFKDDTKIAVGPNARMIVDASMMRGSNRARNFAVKALGGSFRFISGKSDSSAYTIETPNATMGIRGTTFDFWVEGNSQTAIAMLDGRVRMCKSGGECTEVSGQCSLATAHRGKAIAQPTEKNQAAKLIRAGFPFILSQGLLIEKLRVEAGGCGLAKVFSDQIKLPVSQPPEPPVPQPPEPPEPEPPEPPAPEPPEPPAPSTGFPGQSGDEGPSAGKGNSVSDGQNGTGTGSGQGASNRSDNGNNGGGNSNNAGSGSSNGGKGKGNGNGHGNGNGAARGN